VTSPLSPLLTKEGLGVVVLTVRKVSESIAAWHTSIYISHQLTATTIFIKIAVVSAKLDHLLIVNS